MNVLISTIVFVIALVTLFLHGLQGFSKELQSLSDSRLRDFLRKATQNRYVGAFTGALATAFLQSSSAVSAIAIAMTNSGLMDLRSVMTILIGANIGTASTAFLVSFKVQGAGALFLVLGSLVSFLPVRIKVIGKTIFYFGLILFALDQIGKSLSTFYHEPFVTEWLSYANNPFLGVVAGLVLTALLQSSSMLTGLVVMLASEHVLSMAGAVSVILGANIGTTATAYVASVGMDRASKTAAVANVIFNFVGVILVFAFIPLLADVSSMLAADNYGLAVAYSHLIFNITVAVIFLSILTPAHRLITHYIMYKK